MGKFFSKWRSTFSSPVDPADIEYVHLWIDRSHRQFIDQFRKKALIVLILMGIVIFFAARGPAKDSLFITNFIMIILTIFEQKLNNLNLFKRIKLLTLMLAVNNIGYGWTLKYILAFETTISGIIPIVILNTFTLWISIMINPMKPRDTFVFAVLCTIFTLFIFRNSGIQEGRDLFNHFLILTMWNSLAFVIYYWRFKAAVRAALLEKKQEDLFKKSEHLKLESLEQEILLAQEIQYSISAPSGFSTSSGISAHFFQMKMGVLGGDWMGSFEDSRGRMHIIIVDVTGKGVPAALVVHAVQSLWAAARTDPDFESQQWIKALNKTLLTLGQRSPQTLSLGLITISGTRVTYDSAGHIPLSFVTQHSGVQVIKSMRSRENILGVSPELNLVSEVIDLDKNGALWVIGGTEGVFISGKRLSPRSASQMIQNIIDRKSADLQESEANDDKILLLLKKSA